MSYRQVTERGYIMDVTLDSLMAGFSSDDIRRSDRLAAGTEFYELSRLNLEVCKVFRVYLHGDTEEEKQKGYKEALQLLKVYREYCFQRGEGGKAHYEGLIEGSYRNKDAHKHSFAFAFYSLYKNI